MSCSIFFILTHTWGIDILFEKLTQNHGDEFEKHPFCTNMPLRIGISWKTSGLGASEQTKVRGNYVCCLVIISGIWRSKEVGVLQIYQTEERGKTTKKRNFYRAPQKKNYPRS